MILGSVQNAQPQRFRCHLNNTIAKLRHTSSSHAAHFQARAVREYHNDKQLAPFRCFFFTRWKFDRFIPKIQMHPQYTFHRRSFCVKYLTNYGKRFSQEHEHELDKCEIVQLVSIFLNSERFCFNTSVPFAFEG